MEEYSEYRASVNTYVLEGGKAKPAVVEVVIDEGFAGFGGFAVCGLPEDAREVEYRTVRALAAQGYEAAIDGRRVTVTVAPAQRSSGAGWGAGLELPIALAVLFAARPDLRPAACEPVPVHGGEELPEAVAVVGGLSPDGAVYPSRGAGIVAAAAGRDEQAALVLPRRAVAPAAVIAAAPRLRGATTLAEAVRAFANHRQDDREDLLGEAPEVNYPSPSGVRGQSAAAAALASAIEGGARAVLLVGGAGTGKTRLARCAAGLLPPLSAGDVEAITCAQTLADPTAGPAVARPLRAPHHAISTGELLGTWHAPGIVTEADRGVLLLDNVTDFDRGLLAAVGGVLRDRRVEFVDQVRRRRPCVYPADVLLVMTARPCPCGADEPELCRCDESQREQFAARLQVASKLGDATIAMAPRSRARA